MATYISALNAHSLYKDSDNDYYIDHFDDTLTVFQTFRPENFEAVLNYKSPDSLTYQISYSAKDVTGSTVVSGHDFIGPYRTGWLFRQGWTPISAGLHTSLNMRKGEDFCSVGGLDWMHYFARRQFPFNGNDQSHYYDENIPGKSTYGYSYESDVAGEDVADILNAIFGAIFSKTGSWPIDYSILGTALGINTHFQIPWGDQRYLSDMISSMSDVAPGFDFEVTWDMILNIVSPYFFGDPTIDDPTDPFSTMWSFSLDDSTNENTPFDVEFTNNGPLGTHVSGYGAGKQGQIGSMLSYPAGITQFHRLDDSYDFSDVANQDVLDNLTSKRLAYGLNPVHEIPITVIPSNIVNFWTKFRPGRALWVDQELTAHQIQSGQKIVSMTIADNENAGEPTCELGLNQIYGTADNIGVEES